MQKQTIKVETQLVQQGSHVYLVTRIHEHGRVRIIRRLVR